MTPDPTFAPTPRRGFLGHMVAAAAVLGAGLVPNRLLAAGAAAESDDWMGSLKGKHRTVFDVSEILDGKALAQAKNFLNAWRDAFHVAEREVNLVIGMHGKAIALGMTDAIWAKYAVGEKLEITDPVTQAPAVRNLYRKAEPTAEASAAEATVEALQAHGVRFIVCMNSIKAVAKMFSAAGAGTEGEIQADLLAGLLPGVTAVPAMVVALTQLQERGLQYTKIG